MSSLLSFELKEDFFIRIYFNTHEGYELAGIKRAYLDFNRTLPVLNKAQIKRDQDRKNAENYLKDKLLHLINKDFIDFYEFDLVHKKLCNDLTGHWNELTIGHAQKWINMTLKYWLVLGENRVKNIEKNARFFHIPVDRFIQSKIVVEDSGPWSQINNYQKYFEYQTKFREENPDKIPIIEELIFFNNTHNK
jgi:hypothetical protein